MIFEKYSTVSNNRGGLNKSGGLTDSLNINKREDPDKSGGGGGGGGGGSKKLSRSKVANFGCSK